jgi:hypothetical protein
MQKFRSIVLKRKYTDLSLKAWCGVGEQEVARVFNMCLLVELL